MLLEGPNPAAEFSERLSWGKAAQARRGASERAATGWTDVDKVLDVERQFALLDPALFRLSPAIPAALSAWGDARQDLGQPLRAAVSDLLETAKSDSDPAQRAEAVREKAVAAQKLLRKCTGGMQRAHDLVEDQIGKVRVAPHRDWTQSRRDCLQALQGWMANACTELAGDDGAMKRTMDFLKVCELHPAAAADAIRSRKPGGP